MDDQRDSSLQKTVKDDAEQKSSFCRKGYRRKRTAFTQEQLTRLEEAFEHNKYPGIELRDNLAQELKVSEARIQVWFQNRRSKWRRHQHNSKPRIPDQIASEPQENVLRNQGWPYPSLYSHQEPLLKPFHNGWLIPNDVRSREDTTCTSSTDVRDLPKIGYESHSRRLVGCVTSIMSTRANQGDDTNAPGCDDPSLIHYGQTYFGARRSLDEILAAKGLSVLENCFR